MAMPAVPQPITTIDELLALPDDGLRHELLDGVHAVTPAPALRHQRVLTRLIVELSSATRSRPDLVVLSSPADVRLGPRTLVQPDLFVYRELPDHPAEAWSDIGVPVLAIEILSPSTAGRDRVTKRGIYQRAGVAEYWIVDANARVVERWRPADERPEIISEELTWQPLPDMEPSRLDLPVLFSNALGEP